MTLLERLCYGKVKGLGSHTGMTELLRSSVFTITQMALPDIWRAGLRDHRCAPGYAPHVMVARVGTQSHAVERANVIHHTIRDGPSHSLSFLALTSRNLVRPKLFPQALAQPAPL